MFDTVPARTTLRPLNPTELSHRRFLDARVAFCTSSGLDMFDGENGGAGGSGGGQGGGSGAGGQGGGQGGQGGGQGGQGGSGSQGGGSGAQAPDGYATDAQGRNLGYPKDTPLESMKDGEQAAYWRHQSQKHEGRYRNLVGDRSFDETRSALEEHQRLVREQQTPAEQALNDKFEAGKKAGKAESNTAAATAIFEGTLRAAEVPDADIAELTSSLNLARFVTDEGIDTSGITTFAARFKPGTGTQQRPRDFGAGTRDSSSSSRGAAGKAALERRHGKSTSTGA